MYGHRLVDLHIGVYSILGMYVFICTLCLTYTSRTNPAESRILPAYLTIYVYRFPWEAMVKRELTMPFKPLVAVPPILSPGPSSPSKSGGHAVFNPSNQSKSLPYSPLSASSVPSTVSASAGNRPPPSQASSRLTYILPTGLMRYNSNQSKSSHASASAKNSSAPACGYFLPPTNASLPSPPRREGSINRYQSRIWPFCLSGEDEGGSCAAAKRGQWYAHGLCNRNFVFYAYF